MTTDRRNEFATKAARAASLRLAALQVGDTETVRFFEDAILIYAALVMRGAA